MASPTNTGPSKSANTATKNATSPDALPKAPADTRSTPQDSVARDQSSSNGDHTAVDSQTSADPAAESDRQLAPSASPDPETGRQGNSKDASGAPSRPRPLRSTRPRDLSPRGVTADGPPSDLQPPVEQSHKSQAAKTESEPQVLGAGDRASRGSKRAPAGAAQKPPNPRATPSLKHKPRTPKLSEPKLSKPEVSNNRPSEKKPANTKTDPAVEPAFSLDASSSNFDTAEVSAKRPHRPGQWKPQRATPSQDTTQSPAEASASQEEDSNLQSSTPTVVVAQPERLKASDLLRSAWLVKALIACVLAVSVLSVGSSIKTRLFGNSDPHAELVRDNSASQLARKVLDLQDEVETLRDKNSILEKQVQALKTEGATWRWSFVLAFKHLQEFADQLGVPIPDEVPIPQNLPTSSQAIDG